MAIDPKDPVIREYMKQNEQASALETNPAAQGAKPGTEKQEQKITGTEKQQRGPFKKKRAGAVLTKDKVQEIKAGRKKLRKDMKAQGIKSKREFELVAGSLGLYFDKRNGLLLWLFHGRALWALLGAALALLLAFFLMSLISQMRGYFTINLSAGMFKEGFVLSETEDFAVTAVNLTCEPAVDVPCISITQIAEDVDDYEGQHNGNYFAYTFFVRNEGDNTVDYKWELELNDEAKNLSSAAWVMVFEDGDMTFYAEADAETGGAAALPAFDDNSRGYTKTPLISHALYPDQQYQPIQQKGAVTYYRLVPFPFESGTMITSGYQETVEPMEVHKYTVVIWLEGDDPDCTNDLIGGHLGLAMQFELVEEDDDGASGSSGNSWWQGVWDGLKWWD